MEGLVGRDDRLWPIPDLVCEILMKTLGDLPMERMHVAALDDDGRFLGEVVLPGRENSLTARFRSIFEAAFQFGAVGLILSHNHPSGKARPSELDLVATTNILALAQPLDLQIVDHLVVTEAEIYSIRHARVQCQRVKPF